MILDEVQQKAIALGCDLSLRIVTVSGEAGTGKTSLIKELADFCVQNQYQFAIAAPTGKAAKRISEATGYPAMTLHRLLEYSNPGEPDEETGEVIIESVPRRDRTNPLDQHLIIVDEYAMVGTELHRNLVDALSPRTKLRLFGDKSQLPPIEKHKLARPYWPFEEMMKLNTNTHKSIELVNTYRQGEGSGILTAARQIRQGRIPNRNTEFTLKITERHVDELIAYVCAKHEDGVSFASLRNQIISPASTKSWLSSQRLNGPLQRIFIDTHSDGVYLPRNKWDKTEVTVHVGDKVVCTKNMYDMRDYFDRYAFWIEEFKPDRSSFLPVPDSRYMLNGEVGIVTSIDMYGGLEIDVGDRIVQVPHLYKDYWEAKSKLYEFDPRKFIDLAYVLTTHKTQGSEYDNVVYVLDKGLIYLLGRRNFYTAVTRARKTAHMICDQKGLQLSVLDRRT